MIQHSVKASDFEFEYTGSTLTESEAMSQKHPRLTAQELQSRLTDKRVFGDYPMGFTFISELYADGRVVGLNNVGTQDEGTWTLDHENDTLITRWKHGWYDTVTRAYEVNGHIQCFDAATGLWRTTFKEIRNLNPFPSKKVIGR